ncbi:alpha/beta fold hydrolase [Aquipseudomonas alcaligenes]|uniref:alpha/beta fold hydrolase n=1 Tax=Aquipseudomonas alcaligenes TaxID=43263 RepID=UPI003749D27D
MSEDHWIESADGRLFARRWQAQGDTQGASLMLLHDSLGCVELWRDLPERLALTTGRTVIAYDRLGFGRSAAHPGRLDFDFIATEAQHSFAAVCRHFALERFVAVGHSVGGAMAAECAAAFPEQCQAVITLAAQALIEERTLAGIRVAAQAFAQPGQLERLERYHGAKAAWVLDAWTRTWLADEFHHWSLEQTLLRVHCPLLAIHGEQDEYGSLQHPERFAALTAGPVQRLTLPGCGHVPQREQPELVLDAIARFLRR